MRKNNNFVSMNVRKNKAKAYGKKKELWTKLVFMMKLIHKWNHRILDLKINNAKKKSVFTFSLN